MNELSKQLNPIFNFRQLFKKKIQKKKKKKDLM